MDNITLRSLENFDRYVAEHQINGPKREFREFHRISQFSTNWQ